MAIGMGTAMIGSAAISGVGTWLASKKKAESERRSARELHALRVAQMEMQRAQTAAQMQQQGTMNIQGALAQGILPKYRGIK